MVAINIGLDFGTHSTKIAARRRDGQDSEIVTIQHEAAGYPWFGCPSLIRVSDNCLYFGADCLKLKNGHLLRSIKLDLLPETRRGKIVWKNEYPAGVTPDLLAAIYLAWVMQEVTRSVESRFGRGNRISINVGAPMEHYDDTTLSSRYLRILHGAWDATFGDSRFTVKSGMSLAPVVEQFRQRLAPGIIVPSRETRQFEVLPETVAPIISLCQDPQMDPGIYLLIDMGAGTTEVSINRLNKHNHREAKPSICCYFDESIRLGGDDFEDPTQDSAILITRLVKLSKKVWAAGFEKDKESTAAREKWRQLQVLFTGGAARRAGIQAAIKEAKEGLIYPWPFNEICYEIGWHQPKHLIPIPRKEPVDQRSQLAVAHGLSVERKQWNRFWTPFEMEPLTNADRKPVPHEMEGQWW